MTVLSLSIAGLLYICLWTDPKTSKSLFAIRFHSCPHYSITSLGDPKDKLEVALSKASMPNKTLIITVVNKAYVLPNKDRYLSMFDLFLESFWLGEDTRPLLHHLLVIALDQTAYDRCKFRGLHCYKLLTTDGDDDDDMAREKMFKSKEFIKMMWRRTLFLTDVLKLGYNFIFTDADIMWLRNPLTRLGNYPSEDLQISTDWFDGERPEKCLINTGFYYIKSNPKTLSLFQTWYEMGLNSTGVKKKKKKKKETEQEVLLDMMQKGAFRKLGLNVRFLDTMYFSGFCVAKKDVKAVATVHGDCCETIAAKVSDLTMVLDDWKRFKGGDGEAVSGNTSINGYALYEDSKHFACKKAGQSWRSPKKPS